MTHGPTRLPSRKVCIYCGASNVRLTDEHVVPLSLGGRHVLSGASCDACADITKKFEQAVARGLWGDARIGYDAPSRRKRERPTHITLNDPSGHGKPLRVPYSEYPAQLFFYKMFPAGVLQGLPEDVDVSTRWEFAVVGDEPRREAFLKKYPGRLTAKFKHVPSDFARLLAKIGYGQVLTSLDPWDFDPVCIPYILGKKSNPSYLVGGQFHIDQPEKETGYRLQTVCVGDVNRVLLIALIRLYANTHSPTYHSVVGEVRGPRNIQSALEKLGDGKITLLHSGDLLGARENSLEHWMPRIWPIADFS